MRSRSFFTKLDVEKLDIFKPTIDMSRTRVLYFAFGSNLLKERLSFSCPSADSSDILRDGMARERLLSQAPVIIVGVRFGVYLMRN